MLEFTVMPITETSNVIPHMPAVCSYVAQGYGTAYKIPERTHKDTHVFNGSDVIQICKLVRDNFEILALKYWMIRCKSERFIISNRLFIASILLLI
jgi:hypothetical protein